MPVKQIPLVEGAQLFIGAPANPMPQSVSDALTSAVARVPGVREAHLPLIYVQDRMPTSEQMLVVVLERDDHDTILALTTAVDAALPKGVHIVVWPLTSHHSMLPPVRDANCQIFGAPAAVPRTERPWWRFWG